MSRKNDCKMVKADHLPTLPTIAIEAIRLLEGEDSNFSSIADLLRNDQVLTGKILHYANTAHVGARRKISSISQALSLLGTNAVRSIILSAAVFDCFGEKFARRQQSLINFWLHSIGVAVTAEILAEKLAFPTGEEAYLGGLIHDLGKLVCYSQSPAKYEEIWKELERQGTYGTGSLPLEIEQAILGTDHLEMGKVIAENWGFPESLARVMWLHHQPVFETILPERANLPKLIRFADVLCVTHNIGAHYLQPTTGYSHDHYHFALENLVLHHHLTPADITAIMEQVHARAKAMGNILGLWDEETYLRLVRSANLSLGSLSMNLERNIRQLSETNQVLAATTDMAHRLKSGTPLDEAAGIIAEAAGRAFGVDRCLCLLRATGEDYFIGQLLAEEHSHELRIPSDPSLLREQPEAGELESEAIRLLSRANEDLAKGALWEGLRILTGSKFMATFFVVDQESSLPRNSILGELLVDFQGSPEVPRETIQQLSTNFGAFAMAASSAVERLHLEADLTRQAKAMAEATRKMEESQRQLFHSHRLATVGRLAAGAAHEINNPLTIISLNIQLMERLLGQQDLPALKERLRIISDQEERIAKIIQDLMSFARPTQPRFAPSSATDIVGKVLSVLGDRVPLKKVRIDNRLPADLPAITVDPLQIEQVFMNLFINAIHAMPGGGDLTIEAAPNPDMVEISVRDTGEGIDQQHLGKIFDPFFTTKKEGEGTGLGLAICHSIVEHNGGSLRVRSQPGQGTTFTVILPRDKSSRLRALKKRLQQEPAKSPAVREKARILVVDDERILNDMLQESLRAAGYDAKGAYDGLEAIKMLREATYHLLILDIRMPNKDGLEVLEFVRNEFPTLQVLIITALASKEEIKETVKMGAFACLRKPFRLEKVLETVAKALEAGKAKNAETD